MQRLKTRPQFQATLAGGVVARTPHFALHRLGLDPAAHRKPLSTDAANAPSNSEPAPSTDREGGVGRPLRPLFLEPGQTWLGAMVPKRWARRAVTRNAIKRQIYTVSGELAPRLAQDVAYVVRLRTEFDRTRFVSATSDALKTAVRAELLQLLDRVVRSAAAPRSAGDAAGAAASAAAR